MGSKNRIANEIIPIMLQNRKENQWFVDMFCGSCHIIQNVDGRISTLFLCGKGFKKTEKDQK